MRKIHLQSKGGCACGAAGSVMTVPDVSLGVTCGACIRIDQHWKRIAAQEAEDAAVGVELIAHARVRDAAPELLAAARFAYESLLRLPITERINRQAELIALRDAIAKATGQSDQEVQDYFTAKAEGR